MLLMNNCTQIIHKLERVRRNIALCPVTLTAVQVLVNSRELKMFAPNQWKAMLMRDTEERGEEEEDESDLDLAWKMLDLARAISEKHSKETIEMVDILSALAEVSLEREDIETSLSDYRKALSILERLVESDSRRIAQLNLRICLCLEVGSKAEEAILYCQKAVSVCKSRIQRLMDKMTSPCAFTTTSETVRNGVRSSFFDMRQDLTSLSNDLSLNLKVKPVCSIYYF